MKRITILLSIITILVLAVAFIVYPRFHTWARAHVTDKTAADDHPLNCISCHVYTQKSGPIAKIINAGYYSPFNMTVSHDGKQLFVVAEEANMLLIIDTDKNRVIHKIKVGDKPYQVVLSKDEARAFVSNQWSDNVSVIDLNSYKVTDTLKTGGGPAGLALSADGDFLYVVNSYTSNLSIIEIAAKAERKRLAAGNNPTGIAATPDGNLIYVSSRRTMGLPYDDEISCEITVADDKKKRIAERLDIKSAYLMENIAFAPEGDLAIATMIRPKNNLPTVQVDRGWIMTEGIVILEQKPNGRTIQLLLDEPNAFYADPYDIVITPDGKRAFVTHSGVDRISVIDMDSLRGLIAESSDELLKAYANHLGISSRIVIKTNFHRCQSQRTCSVTRW